MFTGIIQSLGIIDNFDEKNNSFLIKSNLDLGDCKVGSSISCDGVCLTAVKIIKKDNNYFFLVNIGEESRIRSNLINWKIGKVINLEKSLRVGDEIAGHFVYGHVDTTLQISKISKLKNSWDFEFSYNTTNDHHKIRKLIVEKGSVAINGISLTVAYTHKNSFNVSIIPHTFENTNLNTLKELDKVNIEFDPLARYISIQYGN